MTLPLYPHEAFGIYGGYLLGTLIGLAFGFVLERAGFGRARNLAAQFYLTDTRVLKVMFSAIVTAMVGMALFAGVGLLDLSLITVPETFLWPQLIGGLLLGAGFIVSGYCPGTGVVAMASGNLDGAAGIGGVMAGSLLFGLCYGPLERFYLSGAMGIVRIDQLLGVPMAVVAAGVVAMAVGAFLGGEKLERIFTRRAGEAAPDSPRGVKVRVFSGFAVVAALALFAVALPHANPAPNAKIAVPIDAVTLARQIIAAPQDVWLLDLRPAGPADRPLIPGAMALPAGDTDATMVANLSPTRKLVVYGDANLSALPAGVASYPGEVVVLTGGWNAWQAAVLSQPVPPATPTPALVAEFQLRNALHARFTGAAAAAPLKGQIKPVSTTAAGPKKGGGC